LPLVSALIWDIKGENTPCSESEFWA